MAFQRPTLIELVDRIQSDLSTRLTLVGAVLRRSVVHVLARVLAAAAHLLHGHLEFLSKQLFPDTSEVEYLERHAGLYGLTRVPATFAAGTLVVWGTNTTVIPIATVLQRSDGAQYDTDAEVTIATLTAWAPTTAYTVGALRSNGGNIYLCTVAGTSAGSGGPSGTGTAIVDNTVTWRFIAAGSAAVLAAVTALVAGEDGSADLGVSLSFVSPIAGANATATVSTGGLASGADAESDNALRARLIARLQQPPHGGAAADYIAWAKEIAGVTRAWVFQQELGAGTVTVRFVRDEDGTGAAIIPSAGEVTAVQDYITARRPVTAAVTVVAPTAVARDFTIHVVPDTAATRAAVQAELEDYLRRAAEPGGSLLISQIRVAVGVAAGVTDFTVTSPAADVSHTTGQIAVMGTITWN